MIVLPKEQKKISLESQLEKLINMKNIMVNQSSHINCDYAIETLSNRIKEIEQKIREKDLNSTFKGDEPLFDTEEYAKKAKGL